MNTVINGPLKRHRNTVTHVENACVQHFEDWTNDKADIQTETFESGYGY